MMAIRNNKGRTDLGESMGCHDFSLCCLKAVSNFC